MSAAVFPMDETEGRDATHMARALELAALGMYTTDPNPRVGCVLVRDGFVVGEGWHERAGEPHAEVYALRAAGAGARGATAYVTLEPCSHMGRTPPCADALIVAGVSRVVCATLDPNPQVAGRGADRLRSAGIDVSVGALSAPARALNPGFFSRFERSRPYVRLKLAMSLDGRTARAGGGEGWITGAAARADVQTLRARSSAVLTGAGTIRVDDPRLDVRLSYGPWIRQPLRIVLDTSRTCPRTAKVFADGGAVVFAADDAGSGAAEAGVGAGLVAVERVPRAGRGLDLAVVIERLAAREINELLVECGPELAAGFLAAGLVDEWVVYVAPTLLGADAAPLTHLLGVGREHGLPAFEFTDVQRVGTDLRLTLTPRKA